MATKIFPSTNDVNGGVAGQGKTLTEANLKTLQAMPYFDVPYVKSGAVCTNGGGLLLTVATGHYCIDGRWVYKDASENVTLTASSTNRVWLQLLKDGSGNVTGTTWVVNTTTAVPSDAVLVAVVVTGAATITTITQSHRGVISPGLQVTGGYQQVATDLTGAGDRASIAVVGDGITPMEIEFEAHIGSSASGHALQTNIYDGAGATGTLLRTIRSISAGASPSYYNPHKGGVSAPAFVGPKSFYLYCASSGTAANPDATLGTKRWIRARWAPTDSTS